LCSPESIPLQLTSGFEVLSDDGQLEATVPPLTISSFKFNSFIMKAVVLRLVLIQVLLFSSVSGIQIWSSPGALPTTIPASCRAALSQNITCDPQLITATFVSAGRALDNGTATEYCTLSCYSSLQVDKPMNFYICQITDNGHVDFQVYVDLRCGNTLYNMYANSTFQQSGAQVANPLAWAYNVTCIKDRHVRQIF
jgi:hypothetical protein